MSKIIITVYRRGSISDEPDVADLEINVDMKVIQFINVFEDSLLSKNIFNSKKKPLDQNLSFYENKVFNGDKLYDREELYE